MQTGSPPWFLRQSVVVVVLQFAQDVPARRAALWSDCNFCKEKERKITLERFRFGLVLAELAAKETKMLCGTWIVNLLVDLKWDTFYPSRFSRVTCFRLLTMRYAIDISSHSQQMLNINKRLLKLPSSLLSLPFHRASHDYLNIFGTTQVQVLKKFEFGFL